ncbi:type IV secretion system protein [Sinorhizobium meliloti]|uniref:type IV secretion system protein n=1 Tax=Rhizobium meliloti TaxID=382 RepID=UPI000FD5CAA7|nr:type IV secretion system protein [Sinorhizobium meliloti]RVL89308.1 hypothetical protein CN136_35080 [Sinorhizobium meliloti]RVN80518.1 hypothetical protein CN101_33345 [Sinorhizobium meliloti]RVO50073.1 hypothetical protein CN094_32675 [Sinorhizobium meliloti]
MRAILQSAVVIGHLLMATGSLVGEARAQEHLITPAPLPHIGPLRPEPDGAQASFDKNAVELLTYLVELSRLIGGGITQLFASAHAVEKIETQTRDAAQAQLAALSGPKTFPVNNGEEDVAAREGGSSLWQMANIALSGGKVEPEGIQGALTEFRNPYRLDDAFALRNDKLASKVNIAYASAQGAVTAATAEDAYKRAGASMSRIDGYVTALETSHDLKTSVDINTRVMIEVAQQLNETLRVQAAIASVAGSHLMTLGAETAEPDSISDLMKTFNR